MEVGAKKMLYKPKLVKMLSIKLRNIKSSYTQTKIVSAINQYKTFIEISCTDAK